MNILALDVTGQPRRWLSFEDAIVYHAKDMVVWSLGETVVTYRGGTRIDGTESRLSSPSIIAIRGAGFSLDKARGVTLTNRTLFARDRHVCAYCGDTFTNAHLSRDHVHPVSKGGLDVWTNVVSACVKCNTTKGNKLIENTDLKLLYVPYEPNHYERMILENRNILADQMEYLLARVPKNSRARL